MKNYYQILGINEEATTEEIRKAYKKMALRYHPDRNPKNPEAEEQFKLINEAYQILSKMDSRSSYDFRRQNQEQSRAKQDYSKYTYTGYEEGSNYRSRQYRYEPPPNYQKRETPPPKPEPLLTKETKLALLIVAVVMIFAAFIGVFMMRIGSDSNFKHAQEAYEAGDIADAIEYLDISLDQNKNNINALILGAEIYSSDMQNYKKAISYLSRAITLEPENSALYQLRAEAHLALRNYAGAIKDFEKVLTLDPARVSISLRIADIYLSELKDFQEAIAYYDNIIDVYEDVPAAYLGRAAAYYGLQDYDKMDFNLGRVKFFGLEDAAYHYYRGLHAFEANQNTNQACQHWQVAATEITKAQEMYRKYCR
ncbi:MAG: DnaJ domain-containing protein [Bernardetiaceae bacterium]|nr:DnaJ domain-containing protein [Bernardetiaceae bacterium]